jgi:hypothetical protein
MGFLRHGEVSERFKEHAWKACVGETQPWVRIPPSPPYPKQSQPFVPFIYVLQIVMFLWQWMTSNDSTPGFVAPFISLDGNLTRRFRYDLGVRREEVRSVKRDRSAYPPKKSPVFLFHSDRKSGNDNFARDAEFAEYVVGAGRRENEIRRLDIRSKFIGKEEVRSMDALAQEFAEG